MSTLLVNVDVPDLQRGIDFYTRAFGLRIARRFGRAVELLGASAPLYLLEKPAGSAPVAGHALKREYARHWTPVHIDFVVPDIHAATTRARDAGARLEGDIQSFGWGRQATLSDSFGHGFCILQFSGTGYDGAP